TGMHSENTTTSFQTPSCPFCPPQDSSITPQDSPVPPQGSCLLTEPSLAPFPKFLGMEVAHRPSVYPPRHVYFEEAHPPCHSWRTSPCIREIRRECGCVQRWYYPTVLHPFNGETVLRIRGQHFYAHLAEWEAVPEHCVRRRVSLHHHEDFLDHRSAPYSNGGHTKRGFFPTEVPSEKLVRSVTGVNAPQPGDRAGREARRSQGGVREQIKQVVSELEEVLGGLKQVQLEMKEVVHQIDVLTSTLDLGEEHPHQDRLTLDTPKGSQTNVVALIHNTNMENDTSTSSSSLTHSPASGDSFPPLLRPRSCSSPDITIEDERGIKLSSETQRTANGSCSAHRTARKVHSDTHKPPMVPPLYPQNGQLKMRTPYHPVKHKMLASSAVSPLSSAGRNEALHEGAVSRSGTDAAHLTEEDRHAVKTIQIETGSEEYSDLDWSGLKRKVNKAFLKRNINNRYFLLSWVEDIFRREISCLV
ncbi:hypothetical protein DNTS_032690, partial [Danionella cerebrum]